MAWPQSVDQALCFGWIDGIKRSIDNDSYQIRFPPRKKTSIWSAVNVEKVELLINQGLMLEAGLVSFKIEQKVNQKSMLLKTMKYNFHQNSKSNLKRIKWIGNIFNRLRPRIENHLQIG